jgi:integrase
MGTTTLAVSQNPRQNGESGWTGITSLVLDGIASPHTHRAYTQALEEFVIWFQSEGHSEFNKATVQKYRRELEIKGLAPSSINVRLAAIRRLALEAADNGLMPPELAAGIARTKGVRQSGVRLGHWLTAGQAEKLLSIPDLSTLKGLRDRAVLAVLIGAGLRRSELAGLDLSHIQQRDGRWLIADLVGKHGHIRTVPLPAWAYMALKDWLESAPSSDGPVFRSVTRHGNVRRCRLSAQAVFTIVTTHAAKLGTPARPHDLRRTFAKLAHLGQSPLEQIQLSLGHASAVTTELYLGVRQDLHDAPCDHLGLTFPGGSTTAR